MLPFLPPNVQHGVYLALSIATAIFTVLKADPTLGTLPWVVGGATILATLGAIFTSSPGDAKRIGGLQSRVSDLIGSRGQP